MKGTESLVLAQNWIGLIREGLGYSHMTVGRHVRDITDCEKIDQNGSKPKGCIDAASKKFEI